MRFAGICVIGLVLAGCKDVNETVTNNSDSQKLTKVVIEVFVSPYDQAVFPAHNWYQNDAPDSITDLGFYGNPALKIRMFRLEWNVAVQPGDTFHYGWDWLLGNLHYLIRSRAGLWADASSCSSAGLAFQAGYSEPLGATLRVSHSSDTQGPIVVEALQWTAVAADVPLDNLVWGDPVVEALPWENLPIVVPFTVNPTDAPLEFDIPDELLQGLNWGIVRYAASDASCSLSHNAFYQSALPTGVPAVSEWGLVVLALLVITVSTVILARRNRAVAA